MTQDEEKALRKFETRVRQLIFKYKALEQEAQELYEMVDERDKKLRSKRLLELSDEKTEAFYAAHIGKEAEVLFEKASRGKAMHGFTRNYVRVELPASQASDSLDNQLVTVRLGGFNHDKTALKVSLE